MASSSKDAKPFPCPSKIEEFVIIRGSNTHLEISLSLLNDPMIQQHSGILESLVSTATVNGKILAKDLQTLIDCHICSDFGVLGEVAQTGTRKVDYQWDDLVIKLDGKPGKSNYSPTEKDYDKNHSYRSYSGENAKKSRATLILCRRRPFAPDRKQVTRMISCLPHPGGRYPIPNRKLDVHLKYGHGLPCDPKNDNLSGCIAELDFKNRRKEVRDTSAFPEAMSLA